jgi:Flp pilus assembly protein TadD
MINMSLRQQLFDAYAADEYATVVTLGDIVLRTDPDDAPVLSRVGAVLSALAQYDAAESMLRRALRLAPESKRYIVHSHLGDLCKNRGDLSDAAEQYAEASCLEPNDATYHIYRGATLARLGRLEEAEAAHQAAAECSEGCIDEAYLNLGLVQRAQRKLADARAVSPKV